MFEDQSIPTDSIITVNSMQDLLDFIETDDFYPFLSNSSINQDNDLDQAEIRKIYTELKTVENIHAYHDRHVYHIDDTTTNDSIMDTSKYNSGSNTSEDSELSPSSISSQSSDSDDIESFDLEEWMIQDTLTLKVRPPKLHEFLRLLLDNSRYKSYASWVNKKERLFKIHKPIQVAYLWEKVKIRKTARSMNYDTFARGIRYYYKSGTMIKTHTRHTYCFGQI